MENNYTRDVDQGNSDKASLINALYRFEFLYVPNKHDWTLAQAIGQRNYAIRRQRHTYSCLFVHNYWLYALDTTARWVKAE